MSHGTICSLSRAEAHAGAEDAKRIRCVTVLYLALGESLTCLGIKTVEKKITIHVPKK